MLTIYNQNFAVVRQTVPLNLKAGLNPVSVSDITDHLEPDSVVLRDPSSKHTLQIREQNYRAGATFSSQHAGIAISKAQGLGLRPLDTVIQQVMGKDQEE